MKTFSPWWKPTTENHTKSEAGRRAPYWQRRKALGAAVRWSETVGGSVIVGTTAGVVVVAVPGGPRADVDGWWTLVGLLATAGAVVWLTAGVRAAIKATFAIAVGYHRFSTDVSDQLTSYTRSTGARIGEVADQVAGVASILRTVFPHAQSVPGAVNGGRHASPKE